MERDRGERSGPDRGIGPATYRARDDGYRAGGRIQDAQGRGTRMVVVALVAVVGLGVLLAAFRNVGSSLAPLLGDLSPTMTPAAPTSEFPPGGPLVEFQTPRLPQSSPTQRGPIFDWTTQAWFVDQRTGSPLEVLGELHGPGATIPVLLPPVVAAFAGF